MSATKVKKSRSSSDKSPAGSVKVYCRMRPLLEQTKHGNECVEIRQEREVAVDSNGEVSRFTFDRVFASTATQAEVFTGVRVKDSVTDVLAGYNATVFAYGQTASGKTHTMEGGSLTDEGSRGIIPRAAEALFAGVAKADAKMEFCIKVSFVEIYMERIRDLLDTFGTKKNLQIREDPTAGIYVSGCTESFVTDVRELLAKMAEGHSARATAATGMNQGSSRSHSVFTCLVTQRDVETDGVRMGKLVLVDLAGSEMVRKTGATGQQLEEAKTINKSLSALGQVINALTDETKQHVPYRDSKLTRMLQDSLGGNAKTSLIICCSSSVGNAMETLSTLRFGSRAKAVKNTPKVNERKSVEELTQLLTKAEAAIDMQASYIAALELRTDSAARVPGDEGGSFEAEQNAAAAILELQERVAELNEQLDLERKELKHRTSEAHELTDLLREKERLLLEAGELMEEAQQNMDSVLGERTDLCQELTTAKALVRECQEQHAFAVKELQLQLESARALDARLKADDAKDAAQRIAAEPAQGGQQASNGPTASTRSHPEKSQATAERAAAASAFSSQDDPHPPLPPSVEPSDMELEALLERFPQTPAALVNALRRREAQRPPLPPTGQTVGTKAQRAADQRVAEMTHQREKLLYDLRAQTAKSEELEAALGDSTSDMAAKLVSSRERQHMRSLQQRLEQLVAVHRQLLRKYAAVELNLAEASKKIALRDERLKSIESSAKANAREQQADVSRLAHKLASLEQRSEHDKIKAFNKPQHESPGPRTLRGGGGGGDGGDQASRQGGRGSWWNR